MIFPPCCLLRLNLSAEQKRVVVSNCVATRYVATSQICNDNTHRTINQGHYLPASLSFCSKKEEAKKALFLCSLDRHTRTTLLRAKCCPFAGRGKQSFPIRLSVRRWVGTECIRMTSASLISSVTIVFFRIRHIELISDPVLDINEKQSKSPTAISPWRRPKRTDDGSYDPTTMVVDKLSAIASRKDSLEAVDAVQNCSRTRQWCLRTTSRLRRERDAESKEHNNQTAQINNVE